MGRISRGSLDCNGMGKRVGDRVSASMRGGIPGIGTRRQRPGGHEVHRIHMLDGRALGTRTIDTGSSRLSSGMAASLMSQSHTDSAPRYLIAGLADSPTRTGGEDDIVWVVQKHDADNSGTNLSNPRTIRETIRGTN